MKGNYPAIILAALAFAALPFIPVAKLAFDAAAEPPALAPAVCVPIAPNVCKSRVRRPTS